MLADERLVGTNIPDPHVSGQLHRQSNCAGKVVASLRGGALTSRAVSVVGFDDTAESIRQDMTTFNFGNADAIRASIGFLLRPHTLSRSARGVYQFEARGYVVERGSTSR